MRCILEAESQPGPEEKDALSAPTYLPFVLRIPLQVATMETAAQNAAQLRIQIEKVEDELKRLKEQLACAEAACSERSISNAVDSELGSGTEWKWPLKAEEYERYARQIILPSVGIKGV